MKCGIIKIQSENILRYLIQHAPNEVQKRKFDDKSIKTILVGYEPNGYK